MMSMSLTTIDLFSADRGRYTDDDDGGAYGRWAA